MNLEVLQSNILDTGDVVDTWVIYCGDNLEQLKKLPAGCVDLMDGMDPMDLVDLMDFHE